MNNKAQNLSEYALILGVVSLALIAMQPYFKRGIQGIIKATSDDLGAMATKDYNATYGQNTDAQNLGKFSGGLINHATQQPITVQAEKKIKKIEYAAPGSDLSRVTNIEKDISQTRGQWTTTSAYYNPAKDLTDTGKQDTTSQGKPGHP